MESKDFMLIKITKDKKLLYLCDFGWSYRPHGVTLFTKQHAETTAAKIAEEDGVICEAVEWRQ